MLHLHRAERADILVHGLAELLRVPPDDPFEPDVVAVPARGIERWLSQRLSGALGSARGGDGVCANVRFPSPAALADEVLSAATGIARGTDPWAPDRLVWPLLEVVDACVGQPWCFALDAHLGGPESGRRYAAARHLAELYAGYGANRPGMLQDWSRGEDTDGRRKLPADLAWQAELYRRLRGTLHQPSPAERLGIACSLLDDEPSRVALPERLSLFGPTRLGAATLILLQALGRHREVHLWLPHPSPALWDRVRDVAPASGGPTLRRTDAGRDHPRHPLLASLGRDSRELALLLPAASDERLARTDQEHRSLLQLLQREIRDDQPPQAPTRIDRDDRSVQIHACHGAARQVEVLREVVVGLLAADPTLEPRDVLVMCPDIEAFAPLVSATFGLADEQGGAAEHPGSRLRVRLADRALRQTNPVLAVLSRLLDLADARLTASQVLDLAAMPPVRRRFRFDDDDLEQLQDWVAQSGVRWGLDAQHRAPFQLQRVAQNTWRAGLDRILLGAAVSEDEQSWLGVALPLDDVDSSDIDLAGRLAELVDRLGDALIGLNGDKPLSAWIDALQHALDALTAVNGPDAWQATQARVELADVRACAADRDPHLRLADVRALLSGRLQGRPTRANFRTGTLTVATLVPMRSVPHRVVALLGLDDGVFPRAGVPDGDDVLARGPWVGERDPRSEDRQLLLDAILATTEHLVVTFSGADERTNAPRPPAVPLGELLDALDATARTSEGHPAREQVLTRHPLQPFDARNFTDGALGTRGPFSHDRSALAGARAAARTRTPEAAFLPRRLPPANDGIVELESLVRLLEHPVRGFLRQRLDVAVLGDEDEPSDALAVELDALAKWGIGNRLLRDRLAGADADQCRQAEWRRGTLPPGPLGARLLDDVRAQVEPLVAAAAAERVVAATTRDVLVEFDDGTVLAGTVPGVHGRTLLAVTYSRLGAKHRLRAWASLLALTAAHPDPAHPDLAHPDPAHPDPAHLEQTWRAVTVGRGWKAPARSTLGPVSQSVARDLLAELVELRAQGLREPLPLPVKTAAAYAQARSGGQAVDNALARARREWDGTERIPGERADAEHTLVWGDRPDLAVLTAEAHLDDGRPADPTRFGTLARRLWEPLLAAETTDAP